VSGWSVRRGARAAAVREVVEETGLTARIFDVTEEAPGEVILNEGEHDGFVWTADPAGLDLAAHFQHWPPAALERGVVP
jgi:8-oxo-dGTP pyrophosphatase MutT (NUDIX family)